MKNFMKWLNTISFTVLLIGGLNYLLMGLFGFDLFGSVFGNGAGSGVVGRIFYSIFGLSALILLVTVIARTVMNDKKDQSTASAPAAK